MDIKILIIDFCEITSLEIIKGIKNNFQNSNILPYNHTSIYHNATDEYGVIINANEINDDNINTLENIKLPNNKPIIVIATLISLEHRKKLFDLGISRLLLRPYLPLELFSWIEDSLMHNKPLKNTFSSRRDLHLNTLTREININEQSITFTAAEYQILKILLGSTGIPIKRETIYQNALNQQYEFDSRTLDVHISNIRKKIRKEKANATIQTIRNVGYVLIKSPQ